MKAVERSIEWLDRAIVHIKKNKNPVEEVVKKVKEISLGATRYIFQLFKEACKRIYEKEHSRD